MICALNEAESIPTVLENIPNWVDEIILVDGHSTDCTISVAKQVRPDTRILSQPKRGKGDAFKCGVAASRGDIIITLDADGTYSPEEMSKFVLPLLEGYDFAKGSRFIGKAPDCMSRTRQVGNGILALASNLLFQTRYTDICSGYYSFNRGLFDKINLLSDGFELEQELFIKIKKLKFNVIEIPHSYNQRVYGVSKTKNFKQGIKNLLLMCLLRLQ